MRVCVWGGGGGHACMCGVCIIIHVCMGCLQHVCAVHMSVYACMGGNRDENCIPQSLSESLLILLPSHSDLSPSTLSSTLLCSSAPLSSTEVESNKNERFYSIVRQLTLEICKYNKP